MAFPVVGDTTEVFFHFVTDEMSWDATSPEEWLLVGTIELLGISTTQLSLLLLNADRNS